MAQAVPYVAMAASAYSGMESAKAQNKAAKAASKQQNTTSVRTPYMNEYIQRIVPYLLQNQQNVFSNRMGEYGLQASPMNFDELFKGINPNYNGISYPQQQRSFGQIKNKTLY